MSLSTHCLGYGRDVARLHRRRRCRRRRLTPISNTASQDNHEKSIHGFPLLFYGMGLRLATFDRRSFAKASCYDQLTPVKSSYPLTISI